MVYSGGNRSEVSTAMLTGSYENSIDAKNRLIIPAKFRDDLGPQFIVTKGMDSCLAIYPMKTWEAQQAEIAKLPRSNARVRAYLRFTNQDAEVCDIDKQGRTVIPKKLKDFAGIDREVITIGMNDMIEIWAKEVYESDPNAGMLTADILDEISEKYNV